jgi:hypothetical protein
MTNFVNLKIKPTQFFGCVYRGRIYVRVFIEVSAHTYMSIYVYTVFLKIYIHGTSKNCYPLKIKACSCNAIILLDCDPLRNATIFL